MNTRFRQLVILLIGSFGLTLLGLFEWFVENHFGLLTIIYFLIAAFGWCWVGIILGSQRKQSIAKRSIGEYFEILAKVLILVVALGAINAIAIKYNVSFDVTKFKQHTLNDQTIELLQNLKHDIKITVFYVDLAPKYIEDLLKEYQRVGGGRVKTEIIDPIVQIGYAAQFGNVINGKEKKAIVSSGAERRDIDFTETILTEDNIDNAIIRVTRPARNLFFLAGHGEYDLYGEKDNGLNEFNQKLLANNMMAQKLVLTKGGSVPANCDLLVVAGAQQELSENEVKIISGYLDRGGDALFLIENVVLTTPGVALKESDLARNPSLNNILNRWGINVATDVVIDVASHASGDVGSPATKNYMPHKAIVKDLDYTFYVRPRSISMIKDLRDTIRTAPLVLTLSNEESWGETNRQLDIKFDSSVDRAGPVPIAYLMWEPKNDKKVSDTRISVFTDADFLSNLYIDQLANAQMGLNVVNWLTEGDYQAFVPAKNVEIQQLNLTSQQKRVVASILIAIPLGILLIGILFWLKQRFD